MGIRITNKRKKILDVLKRHSGTLSASDVHKKLPEIDLVTIYRNLDLFVKEKIITKVQLGVNQAQYEYQEEPHHHAVCTECKKVIHFNASDEKIKKLLGLSDFKIDQIDLMVRGVCNHK